MDELTSEQWDSAYKIAEMLNREGVKVNELQKSIAYLRSYGTDDGAKFFTYLQVLEREGYRVGHSKQTQQYYQTLNQACRQHLKGDVPIMLQVLGWAARLLRYYSSGGLVETIVPQAIVVEKFEIGQILDATIEKVSSGKKRIEVTYLVSNGQKRSNDEHKRYQELLQVGAVVKVEVVTLKENGMFNKIKLWDG